jgi:hypothetical protein
VAIGCSLLCKRLRGFAVYVYADKQTLPVHRLYRAVENNEFLRRFDHVYKQSVYFLRFNSGCRACKVLLVLYIHDFKQRLRNVCVLGAVFNTYQLIHLIKEVCKTYELIEAELGIIQQIIRTGEIQIGDSLGIGVEQCLGVPTVVILNELVEHLSQDGLVVAHIL